MAHPHFVPEITDSFVEMHEQYLVPAIYAQWAYRVAELAEIDSGNRILDVACGTGPLARAAKLETGLTGHVTGLDSSEKMLEVARQHSKIIDWQLGDAIAMPFDKNQFDRVLCQFALMFIENRVRAIKEMLRVCRPNGLIVIAIWSRLDSGGAYARLFQLVQKHAGAIAAKNLAAPWSLGKSGAMDVLLLSAGVNEYECHERMGQASYPTKKAFIDSHLQLAGALDSMDEECYRNILSDADSELRPFLSPGGQLIAHQNANIYVVKDD
ncbi:MAG: methyltransferase domain-containing protein [Gammaproteobacteria bacterium]|nr:methyltransferase domain-containing protein [Gammaproteobacteria bacterium]